MNINYIIIILLLLLLTLIIILINCLCKNDKFEDTSKSIPKVIYLTHKKTIPDYVINNWKKLNPEYTIKFYDDEMCRKFIDENYPKSFVKYFDMLSEHKGSGPIKCDFWRLLILYKYGGVYADSDIELLKPIKTFLEPDTDFLTCNTFHNNFLNPHFIISRPGNIILEKCIEIYKNEKFNIEYSYWRHSIVLIMCKAFEILNIKHDQNTEVKMLTFNNKNYKIQLLLEKKLKKTNFDHKCYYKNKPVLNNRYSNYHPVKHEYK